MLARGDRVAAEQELIRVLVIEPNHPDALTDLAVLALARGDPAAAITYVGRIPEPVQTPRSRFYLALGCEACGRAEEARELYRGLEQEPGSKYAGLARARHSNMERGGT